MEQFKSAILGKTGLKVGRLGVAASYGASSAAFEEAFEHGCNYFYWGSFRTKEMLKAIKNISNKGKRDDLCIVVQSYSRSAFILEHYFNKALKTLGMDHVDVLLLGWHNDKPNNRIIDKVLEMKERRLFKFLALSGHNRKLFPELNKLNLFDIFHVRYNAVHNGAEKETFPYLQTEPKPGVVTYTATCWGKLLNPKFMPKGESPLQASDCYRFVLSNPNVDICMSGPKDLAQMRIALKSLELGPLNDNEMERIRKIGNYIHNK